MTIQQIFISSLLTLLALVSLLSGSSKDSDCIYSALVKNVVIVQQGVATKHECLPIEKNSKHALKLAADLADAQSFFEMLQKSPRPASIEIVDQMASVQSTIQKGLVRLSLRQFYSGDYFVHSLLKSMLLQSLDDSVASHPLHLEMVTDFTQAMTLRHHVAPFVGPAFGLWSTETICDSPWNPIEYEFSCKNENKTPNAPLSLWGLRPYLLRSFHEAHSAISIAERIQFTKNLFQHWAEKKWSVQNEFQVESVLQFQELIKKSWQEVVGPSVHVISDFKPYEKMDGLIFSDKNVDKNLNLVKKKKYAWFDKGQWYLPSEKNWIKVKWGAQTPTFQQLHVFSCHEPKISDLLSHKAQKREIIFLSVCERDFSGVSEVVHKNPYLIAKQNPKRRLIVYDRPSLEISLNWGFKKNDQIVERFERKNLSEKQLRITGLGDVEEAPAPKSENIFFTHDIEKISAALPVVQYLRL